MAMTYATKTFSPTDAQTFIDEVMDWILEVCPYFTLYNESAYNGTTGYKQAKHENGIGTLGVAVWNTDAVTCYASVITGSCKYNGHQDAIGGSDITIKFAFDDNGYYALVLTKLYSGVEKSSYCCGAVLEDLYTGEEIGVYNNLFGDNASESGVVETMVIPAKIYSTSKKTEYSLSTFPSTNLKSSFAGRISKDPAINRCIAMPTIFYVAETGICNPMVWKGKKHKTVCFQTQTTLSDTWGNSVIIDGEEAVTLNSSAGTNLVLFV